MWNKVKKNLFNLVNDNAPPGIEEEGNLGNNRVNNNERNPILQSVNLNLKNDESKNEQNAPPEALGESEIPSLKNEKIFSQKKTRLVNCFLFIHFLLFLSTIAIIILTTTARENIEENEVYYFRNLVEGWKESPINSIIICTNENKKNIINQQWMGTKRGCLCAGSLRNVDQGGCGKYCRKIQPLDPIDFVLWRNVPLCRKFEEKIYFDLNIEENASNCPSGTRSCGQIDTQKNHLCVENNNPCPINEINIIENNQQNSAAIDKNVISLYKAELIYSNQDDDGSKIIPIIFKISENIPCRNPYFDNIRRPLYVLDYYFNRKICYGYIEDSKIVNEDNGNSQTSKTNVTNLNPNDGRDFNNIKNKDGDLQYNYNFKVIDSYSMELLYAENKISEKTFQLPDFPLNYYNGDNDLSAKPYFGLKINCFKMIKNENLKELLFQDISLFFEYLDDANLMLVAFIFSIILTVFYFYCNFVQFCSKKRLNVGVLRFLISLPFLIGLFVPLVMVVTKSTISNNLVRVFSNPECVDNYTIGLFSKFSEKLEFVNTIHLANIILCSVIILFEFVIGITLMFE